jgi:tetratricopeptide (TPR) repeat protein
VPEAPPRPREGVSEREKFVIESQHYFHGTGDLEKARQAYELWAQTYPRDWAPTSNLGVIEWSFGQYDRALAAFHEALRIEANSAVPIGNLVRTYLSLNRLEEARTTVAEAQAKNLDSTYLCFLLYEIAFLKNDAAGMAQQLTCTARKAGWEDMLLASKADTAAHSGRLRSAHEFSRQAVASAALEGQKETAAIYEADAALREALFGNAPEARQYAAAALALSTGRDVRYATALALASAGDAARAQALADEVAKLFPDDTILQFNYLPTIRAQLALNRNDPSKAIEALLAAAPYEFGAPGRSIQLREPVSGLCTRGSVSSKSPRQRSRSRVRENLGLAGRCAV